MAHGRSLDDSTLQLDARSGDRPAERAFVPGDRVAGRYTIVRFLGEGGMGEVYEAIDEELHDRVALKTVRPEIASDELVRVSFKREVHLARKVTHPNVCRLFDIGFHGDTMFLTMEHLGGETLAQRLRRREKLPVEEALPIAAGIAAGLDAAHQSGVVHGDLKPGNVMLVPGRGGERVVVTDFGIALWLHPADHALAGGSEPVMGSPAYMAPERVEARQTVTAADIYSFGVLLYRMVTGVLPYPESKDMASIRQRGTPAAPRAHTPGLDPRWDAAILRCLLPHPDARFAHATDIVQALERRPPRRRRKRLAATLAALAMVAAASIAWWAWPRGPARPLVVAVLPPHNASGRSEIDWLSPALAERLVVELSTGGKLHAPPWELVGREPATDRVLTGSFVATGDRLRLELELRDARTGKVDRLAPREAAIGELAGLAAAAADDARARLGARAPSAEERADAAALLPPGTEATRHYGEALRRIRRFEYAAALEALDKTTDADPHSAIGYTAIAEANWFLGNEEAARYAAKQAVELAEEGPERQRLWAQARFFETVAEPKQAALVLERLFDAHPLDLDYGIALFLARWRHGDITGARQVISELRRLPRPWRDDPRIDIVDLRVASGAGSAQAAATLGRRLLDRGTAEGILPFQFEGLSGLTNAYWSYGALDAALAHQRKAIALAERLGDVNAATGGSLSAATILIQLGRLQEAAAEIGAAPFQKDVRGVWLGRQNIMNEIALRRGDLRAAREGFLRERDSAFDNEGRRYGYARPVVGLARVDLLTGNLPSAARRAADVQRTFEATDPQARAPIGSMLLGDIALARDDLPGARGHYEAARRTWHGRRNLLDAARALTALAETALHQGSLVESEALARAASLAFAGMPVPDDRALAGAVLARALLGRGLRAEAQAALAPALPALERSERLAVRVAVGLARADVDADREAAARIARLADEAGCLAWSLPARLVAAGSDAGALQAVAADASRAGFSLVARQALARLH